MKNAPMWDSHSISNVHFDQSFSYRLNAEISGAAVGRPLN
jgi:hypothetical protein